MPSVRSGWLWRVAIMNIREELLSMLLSNDPAVITETEELDNPDRIEERNVTIEDIITEYKSDFTQRDLQERFKWEAVYHYQKHWDLQATDFAEMLSTAFYQARYLLSGYRYNPYQCLCKLAKARPDTVRTLFQMLHNEELSFPERYTRFRSAFDTEYQALMIKENPERATSLNHYQDLHAVSVYLFFQYPEKYYIYKQQVYKNFRELIEFEKERKPDKDQDAKSSVPPETRHETWRLEQYNRMCEQVLKVIQADKELLAMSQARLPEESCYQDPAWHLLTTDVIYFGSQLAEGEKDLVRDSVSYWPSLEEYDPGISKDTWLSALKNPDLTSAEHLALFKMLLTLGGESTCAHLAEIYGKTPGYYNGVFIGYARKIKDTFHCPDLFQNNTARYFPVLFTGRYVIERKKKRYSYRLRAELRQALEKLGHEELTHEELAHEDLTHKELTHKELVHEELTHEELTHKVLTHSDIRANTDASITEKTPVTVTTTKGNNTLKTDIPKNTILYGPPGTGKTYSTVQYAVAIIENCTLKSIQAEPYEKVLERFHAYQAGNQIEMTTFHQSYGYEEFIEGIRPVMGDGSDEDGSGNESELQYEITPGLFQSFCEHTSLPDKRDNTGIRLNHDPTIWKVSLEGTGNNPTREECMREGHIRIGWDGYGEHISSATKFVDGGRNVLNAFIFKMKPGDIVLSCYSNTTIDAIGVITGEAEWHKEYSSYKRLRKVNWLVKGMKEDITEINGGRTLTLSTVYKLSISLSDVMEIVKKYTPPATLQTVTASPKNYVFIIDEINRGNISKIFGELITLIEPSRRIGQPEGTKIRLPYSKKPFGVPDNVYLIGTMNTADRSIATLDTALRRRFQFREMLPDASVLVGISVEGVSVSDMLVRMNRRIRVLYDREHMIGHSYFMPLQNPEAGKQPLELLADIFANQIIPLLQEYFYEDYEKIRLVLGDNQKTNREDQFILETRQDYGELFGSTAYDLDETNMYEINPEAFHRIEAYRLI